VWRGLFTLEAGDRGGKVPANAFRVHVDPEKCQGHNRCYAIAPDLFDLDDLGTSSAAGDGLVPQDRLTQARLAVANCPEYAVTLTEVTAEARTEATTEATQVQP
jgi:ferredoxin